jgi:preprotein translocase subunit YajC
MPVEQGANPLMQFPIIPYVLIILIFYFLIIRPQKQKQSQHKQMMAGLKKNDEIVTAGGIHGTIVNVKDSTVVVRIDDNVRVEVDKEAVSSVLKSGSS